MTLQKRLFDLVEETSGPTIRPTAGRIELQAGWKRTARSGIRMACHTDLTEVIAAFQIPRAFADCLHCGQKNRHQDRNRRNDDQQLEDCYSSRDQQLPRSTFAI